MDARYLGNEYCLNPATGLCVLGDPWTPDHKASGGYRVDFVNTLAIVCALYDMEFILSAPNGIVHGQNSGDYAVYRLLGTPYYAFYVHGHNFKRGIIKRGERFCDPHSFFGLHLHIKKGGYSPQVNDYLDYLTYVDPLAKITAVKGVTWGPGLNKGAQLPIFINDTEMVQLQEAIHLQTTHTSNDYSVRVNPLVEGKPIMFVPIGLAFSTKIVASGQNATGRTTTWYGFPVELLPPDLQKQYPNGGFIYGDPRWVKEVPASDPNIAALLNDRNDRLHKINQLSTI